MSTEPWRSAVDPGGRRLPGNAQTLGLLCWFSGAVIAFLIPQRPFDYYFFELLVVVLGAVIPGVRRVGTIGSLGAVAQAYWAVMWIWVLLWLPLFFRLTDEQVRPLEKARQHPVVYRLSPLIVILVFVYVYFVPGGERFGRTVLGSVWGLAIFGSLLFASVSLFIRALVTWRRYLPILEPASEKDKDGGERDV